MVKTSVRWCQPRPVELAFFVVAMLSIMVVVAPGCSGSKETDTPLGREIKIAQEKVKASPNDLGLRVRLSLLYTNDGRYKDAERELKDALVVDPKHQGALSAMGNLYVEEGKNAEAIAPLTQVIDMNADNPMKGASRELETVYYLLGKAYVKLNQADKAVASLKEALLIDRTDSDAHLLLGQAYQLQGKHDDAIKQLNEAIRFVPDFTEVYQALAVSYRALGKPSHEAYSNAMVSFSSGAYKDAQGRLEKIIAADSGFAPAYLGLGMTCEKLGLIDQAVSSYKKVIELDPESFLAKQRLSILASK